MVKETITAVKIAEKEAANLAKQTEEKKNSLLNEAKVKVASYEEQQQQDIKDYRKKAEDEATQKNRQVMKQAKEEADSEITKLMRHADQKKMEAIQLILNTIG